MRDVLGDFHFDSERSRAEQDFRIFIRPSAWSSLREFCLEHISLDNDLILETSPTRSWSRSLPETLCIDLRSDQYVCQPVTTVVENKATSTQNIYASGTPTVRVYRSLRSVHHRCVFDTRRAEKWWAYLNRVLVNWQLQMLEGVGRGRQMPFWRCHGNASKILTEQCCQQNATFPLCLRRINWIRVSLRSWRKLPFHGIKVCDWCVSELHRGLGESLSRLASVRSHLTCTQPGLAELYKPPPLDQP